MDQKQVLIETVRESNQLASTSESKQSQKRYRNRVRVKLERSLR